MKNDYEFWNYYLKNISFKILQLCNKKDFVYVDFHIHSNYSSDGKQTIRDIIKKAQEKKFDIIAITDHDTIDAFDELYEIIKNGISTPIIIPGIEFTADDANYGNQCHILKLFINPKDKEFIKEVKENYNASFNRSKLQLKRLRQNKAMNKLIRENNISITYKEYRSFLKTNHYAPEYDTISEYLMNKFKEKCITNYDILSILEKDNENDIYPDRKRLKEIRFEKLHKKYDGKSEWYNIHFLLSILAVREVDDDWWDKPSSGSLSVNSYGQKKPSELSKKYLTFWAHPSENKLDIVKETLNKIDNIIGLEKNYRNHYNDIDNFNRFIKENNLLEIIGSDTHDTDCEFYSNMSFYKLESSKVRKIVEMIYNEED